MTVTKNTKSSYYGRVCFEISRIPYSLWCFFLLYHIYRLVVIRNELLTKEQDFVQDIIKTCYTVQNASNYALSLQNVITTNTVNDIVTVTNDALTSIEDGLKFITSVGPELFTLYLEYKTKLVRCPTVALLTMATEGILSQQQAIESTINTQLTNGVNTANSDLNGIINTVNTIISEYNNIMSIIQSAFPTTGSLTINTISSISVPYVSIPITNYASPDYSQLFVELTNLIDPLTYLSSDINSLNFNNISAQQVMAALDINNVQSKQLDFCSQMNITEFEVVTNDVTDAIYGMIALIAIIIGFVCMVESAFIINNNRERPWRLINNIGIRRFIKHVWHKPSMTCLLVGILGIIVYKSLELAVADARDKYIVNVFIPVQNYTDYEINITATTFANLSVEFATLVNSQIDEVKVVFDNAQNSIDNAVNQLANFQTAVNTQLNQTVGAIVPEGQTLLQLIQCVAVILTVPLTDLYSLIPDLDNFPNVPNDILDFNVTHAQQTIYTSLNYILYPFDYYSNKFENDVQIYYFLTIFGSIVFIGGLIFAVIDMYKYLRYGGV